jgi:hypothetical protein
VLPLSRLREEVPAMVLPVPRLREKVCRLRLVKVNPTLLFGTEGGANQSINTLDQWPLECWFSISEG